MLINSLDKEQFTEQLGWVFEHSPWVAERAWHSRPFRSVEELSTYMNQVVASATHAEQLALLCAHPDLGTRAKVSQSSASEQAGAGLDQLTSEEFEKLLHLNTAYRAKFGFPFLYAVKGSDKHQILAALEARLELEAEAEFQVALAQVYRIARFRLEEIFQ